MRYFIFILTILTLSCTKGEKALKSGTWKLDSYTYNGVTKYPTGVTVNFGDDGKLNINQPNAPTIVFNYSADNNIINVNGSSYHYTASKKKLEVDALFYPTPSDPNDPLYNGHSSLSK